MEAGLTGTDIQSTGVAPEDTRSPKTSRVVHLLAAITIAIHFPGDVAITIGVPGETLKSFFHES
jgi:hypothetical protein